jgi:hypothetical protein
MTEARLALSELLEKAGDGDFLRTVAEAVLQLLMEADVECQWRLKFCQKWRSKFDHSVAYRSRPQSRSGLISTSTLRGSGGLCGRHHDLRRPAAATWRHIACGGLARMSWLGQEIRVLA